MNRYLLSIVYNSVVLSIKISICIRWLAVNLSSRQMIGWKSLIVDADWLLTFHPCRWLVVSWHGRPERWTCRPWTTANTSAWACTTWWSVACWGCRCLTSSMRRSTNATSWYRASSYSATPLRSCWSFCRRWAVSLLLILKANSFKVQSSQLIQLIHYTRAGLFTEGELLLTFTITLVLVFYRRWVVTDFHHRLLTCTTASSVDGFLPHRF